MLLSQRGLIQALGHENVSVLRSQRLLGLVIRDAIGPAAHFRSDAAKLMEVIGLSTAQVEQIIPPAQYASEGEPLFHLTGGNRFLCYGNLHCCLDINQTKIGAPIVIDWQVA